jgi:hypothetical protein
LSAVRRPGENEHPRREFPGTPPRKMSLRIGLGACGSPAPLSEVINTRIMELQNGSFADALRAGFPGKRNRRLGKSSKAAIW